MGRVKRIWYLSPMRAAKVQASLRIRAVSPEPPLLTHTSSESRGTVRQKARSLAPLNGWACSVEICHDGMLEDTNSLDGAHMMIVIVYKNNEADSIRVLPFCLHLSTVVKLGTLSLTRKVLRYMIGTLKLAVEFIGLKVIKIAAICRCQLRKQPGRLPRKLRDRKRKPDSGR